MSSPRPPGRAPAGAATACLGACPGARPWAGGGGGSPSFFSPVFSFPVLSRHSFAATRAESSAVTRRLCLRACPVLPRCFGAALSLRPPVPPSSALGDPSLLHTRAIGLRYARWCCFTVRLEVLSDAVASLHHLLLTMVVIRGLRASSERAGKGQQQKAEAKNQD